MTEPTQIPQGGVPLHLTMTEWLEVNVPFYLKLEEWIHENPTTTKVATVGLLVLGAVSLASLPVISSACGLAVAITVGVAASLISITSIIALVALDVIIPPHHDMTNHLFTPGFYGDGKLYYQGDIPILSLLTDDPYKAGEAHGYLCGEAIETISKRVSLIVHTLMGQPRANEIPQAIAQVKKTLPEDYINELRGLVDGYAKWQEDNERSSSKMTLEDALLLHLMPDARHFHPSKEEGGAYASQLSFDCACTAIINKEGDELVVARNMDWPSFGLMGAYSLVIHRQRTSDSGVNSSINVGIPGLIGTLTGVNDKGLFVGMNVCLGETLQVRGMPAVFYNRHCLEHCDDVQAVENRVQEPSTAPLGPYHLVVLNENKGSSLHFYQGEGESHVIRHWEEGKGPLITLNFRYNPNPVDDSHNSALRQQMIEEEGSDKIENDLALKVVNNNLTMQKIVFRSEAGTLGVAFDNAFAGKESVQNLNVDDLFSSSSIRKTRS